MTHILVIDQGTTSSRAIIYDSEMNPISSAQEEFAQHFPDSGWVEHDGREILQTVLSTARDAIAKAGVEASDIVGAGITNQRETTVVWDRESGEPICNAIVWQDRRTAATCAALKSAGHEEQVRARTGLLLDPYFSASKVQWILDNTDGARARAENGELLFGTIDSWLIWHLTGGASHVTDATNAARTMLYDIHENTWSDDMCALFDVPRVMLPEVKDCAADFGVISADLLGASIPICGVAGDQQAATIGQACFKAGMIKSTYGTGCFALLNTGDTAVTSQNRLLTTIAYRLDGRTTYALEGSIYIAGAAVKWLRDQMGLIESAPEADALAIEADPNQDVILVPAFTGLAAPYWNSECRGGVFGLERGSGRAELAKATLESVGFQTRDLFEAIRADWQGFDDQSVLRVDGGMAASDFAMQFLADICDMCVERPANLETTALGAAWLAGQHLGIYPDMKAYGDAWAGSSRYDSAMDGSKRETRYARWKRAVDAVISVQ